jgi:hypothetical protein
MVKWWEIREKTTAFDREGNEIPNDLSSYSLFKDYMIKREKADDQFKL